MTHDRQNYRQLCLDNSSQQVAQGRGRNIIPPPKERPLWMGFLEKFRDWNFITIKQTGISITKAGLVFLDQIPVRLMDIKLSEGSTVGEFSQGVIVYGVGNRIVNGMEQRDAGIKAGAFGCTTVVLRDGKLMIPPDWNLDEQSPELAYKIRKESGITADDAIIVGSGPTKVVAIEAALNAAFELL